MAPANTWLSSCFAPSEVLRPCQNQVVPAAKFMPFHMIASDASHPFLFEAFNDDDNAYKGLEPYELKRGISILCNGKTKPFGDWLDVKAPIFYPEEETKERELVPAVQQPILLKYEHSVDNHSSIQSQASSPSSVYEQQDFAASDPKSLSANSGSEIVESSSVKGNALPEDHVPGYLPEPGANAFGFTSPSSFCLPVVVSQLSPKAGVSTAGTVKSKKSADTVLQRTSAYRGVTRHRWTGRFEAHLWDNSCRREGQSRKGRQVYLGGYDKEEKAARAYDLAALKYWSGGATTNFPVSSYTKELEEMKNMTKQEFVASLRRKSSGFSRGASVYRGVTRHHQQGRWQARIGRVAGNKDLYLGTFATEEEAAEAYDIAAIKFRGVNAVTNFEMGRYDLEAIAASVLPIGSAAKRLKQQQQVQQSLQEQQPQYLPAIDGNVRASSAAIGLVGYHGEAAAAASTPAATAFYSRLIQLGASCSSVDESGPLSGFYEGSLFAVDGNKNEGAWNGTDSF